MPQWLSQLPTPAGRAQGGSEVGCEDSHTVEGRDG